MFSENATHAQQEIAQLALENQNSILIKRQTTNVAFDGQGPQHYDVISIGTKHRPSITQFSNDQPLVQVKETKIETRSSPREGHITVQHSEIQAREGTVTPHSPGSPGRQQQTGSPNRASTTSFKRLAPANEHIISIFDGETEKSYILEQTKVDSNANEKDKNGPSIFKVQEIGTARFKCLPVTDYGKIMSLHKQRQRKVQTANGPRSRGSRSNQNQTTQARVQKCLSIRTGPKQGVNSTETFNAGVAELKARQANQNPSSLAQEPPLSPTSQNPFTSNKILFHDAGRRDSRNFKGRTVHTHKETTSELSARMALNSGASGVRELRNSRSTAASGQRKEVFSKTRIVNEQGVAMT